MKKQKKLLALIVAMIMLATFATSAIPVFAEADTTKTFTVGETGYDKFSEAAAAAVQLSEPILYLNKDAEVDAAAIDGAQRMAAIVTGSLIIDGRDLYDLKLDCGGRFDLSGASNSLTIRNLDELTVNYTAWSPFVLRQNTSLTLNNINTVNATAADAAIILMQNDGTSNVTIENVDKFNVTHTAANSGTTTFISDAGTTNKNVSIKNSNIVVNSLGNPVMSQGNVNGTITLSMDGTSSLEVAMTNGWNGIFNGNINLTLESGAELIANSTNTKLLYFNSNGGKSPSVTDNGALYTVGANHNDSTNSYVTFPSIGETYVQVGATGTPQTVAAGTNYTNTTGAAITFTKKVASADSTFTVGTDGYDTFSAAANAAVSSGDHTVYLNKDAEIDAAAISNDYVSAVATGSLIIDGRDQYDLTMMGGRFDLMGGSNSLTIRNLDELTVNYTAWSPFILRNGNSLTLDNINAVNVTTGQAMIIMRNGGASNVEIKDVDALNVTHTTGNVSFINDEGTTNKTVTVENSNITLLSAGDAIVSASTMNFTMDGTSSMKLATNSGNWSFFSGAFKVTLASGANLIADSSIPLVFVGSDVKLTDNGALYTVGANQTSSVTFPSGHGVYVEQLAVGSTAIAKTVSAGLAFTNSTGSDVTFKKGGEFANVLGASIRTEAPYGIRFTATMAKNMYDTLTQNGATFGIVIAPYKNNVEGFDQFYFTRLADQDSRYHVNVVCENVTVNGDVVEFKAAVYIAGNETLTGATEAQLKAAMCACAYYTVDGNTTWAEFNSTDNVRSIYDVAKAYYEDTVNGSTENATINGILTTCGYFGDAQ